MRSDFSRSSKKPKNLGLDASETASTVPLADNDFCPAFGRPDCAAASRLKGEDSIEIRSKMKRVMRQLPVHQSGAAPDTDGHASEIRLLCGKLAGNPLAEALTSSGWPTVLSSESDAIVPVNSQLAGSAQNTIFPLSAEVHSPGTEDLGFAGPSELDDTSVVTPEVLQLLNTPVDQAAFKRLP